MKNTIMKIIFYIVKQFRFMKNIDSITINVQSDLNEHFREVAFFGLNWKLQHQFHQLLFYCILHKYDLKGYQIFMDIVMEYSGLKCTPELL